MFGEWLGRMTRRMLTGYPSNATPELHNAWLGEQVRAYATPQPYAGPLTSAADNWSGETWEMREGYRKFAFKEPAVKSALMTKILAVSQLDLVVTPDDKADKQARRVAQFVKWAIQKSKGGCPDLVQKIGLHALIDGFSVTEKVLDVVPLESPRYAGFWTLKEGKTKESRGIRFRLDPFKNVVGVRSMIAAQGGAEFAPEDFIIFTHLPLFESPFGLSDLRAANRAANLIEAAIKLRAILLENFSGPYLIGKSQDPGTRTKIMETLRDARARGWIVVPESASVEVINLATSAPDQFQATIEDLRQEIVTAIQGAYLQLLEGGVSDGRGNTQVHKSVAELFQWWLSVTICSAIYNSLVPDLVYPNFGYSVGLPTVQLGGVNVAAILQELDRFKKGQELGVKLSNKQVCEVGGFETPEDDDDLLLPPQQQVTAGGGDGNPPDLNDIFGGGGDNGDDQPDGGAVQSEPNQDQSDPGADAVQKFAQIPYREFSEEEYAAMSFADRSHLVAKQVQDKHGIWRKVYVNPNSGDHGDEATRLAPRTNAEDAIKKALSEPHAMTPQDLATLPQHLATLTVARKRELLRALRQKVGGNKAAIADRILQHVRGKVDRATAARPAAPVAPPPPLPPSRPANGFPAGMDTNTVSPRTRSDMAAVAAGTLAPERAGAELAQRLLNTSRVIINNVGAQYGINPAELRGLSDARAAQRVAREAVSVASGTPVPDSAIPTPNPPRAVSPPPAPPPPPTRPASPPPAPAQPAGPRAGTTLPPPTAAPTPRNNLQFTNGESGSINAASQFFGRPVTASEIGGLANAVDGSEVTVRQTGGGGLQIETRSGGHYASRTFSKTRDGKTFVHNNYFRVYFQDDPNPNPPPKWLQKDPATNGAEMLSNQIRSSRAAGLSFLETHAARLDADHPNDAMNGYYTWPRLGYDDSIGSRKVDKLRREEPALYQLLVDNPVGSTKPNSVLNLMSTEDGRKWWKKHGEDLFDMKFDLTPGSLSMRTNAAYAESRNAGARD